MKTMSLSLATRKNLVVAATTLRQPAVFVKLDKLDKPKAETREAAELRRERVESITRKPPEVVITRRWIQTASHFDAQAAVVVKLPWMQRLREWLRSE